MDKEPTVGKYFRGNGRNAESLVRMFEYLLLKTIDPDHSGVDLVERHPCCKIIQLGRFLYPHVNHRGLSRLLNSTVPKTLHALMISTKINLYV